MGKNKWLMSQHKLAGNSMAHGHEVEAFFDNEAQMGDPALAGEYQRGRFYFTPVSIQLVRAIPKLADPQFFHQLSGNICSKTVSTMFVNGRIAASAFISGDKIRPSSAVSLNILSRMAGVVTGCTIRNASNS